MSADKPHPKALTEFERECIPGLVAVLRREGVEGVRHDALWNVTGWQRDYDACVWRSRADKERKRVGWATWVRIEEIIVAVLHEVHGRQAAEATDAFEEGPDSFYRSHLDRRGGIDYRALETDGRRGGARNVRRERRG